MSPSWDQLAPPSVTPFAGPDDTLSPLRWMFMHLNRCRTIQGSLADDFYFCLNVWICHQRLAHSTRGPQDEVSAPGRSRRIEQITLIAADTNGVQCYQFERPVGSTHIAAIVGIICTCIFCTSSWAWLVPKISAVSAGLLAPWMVQRSQYLKDEVENYPWYIAIREWKKRQTKDQSVTSRFVCCHFPSNCQ